MLNDSFGEEIPLPQNQQTTYVQESQFGGWMGGGAFYLPGLKIGESLRNIWPNKAKSYFISQTLKLGNF